MHRFAYGSPGALNLSAVAEEANAVGVFIFHVEIVPNLARFVPQLLAGTLPPAFYRVIIHHPVADVQVVNVLLANMIAAKPDVMIPIVDLSLQISCSALAPMPDRVAIDPISAHESDVTDGTVLDA